MRFKEKQLTLQQKVFIVKRYYQLNDVLAVQRAITEVDVYSSTISPIILQIVQTFEATGSVNQSYIYETTEECHPDQEVAAIVPESQPIDVPEKSIQAVDVVYQVVLVDDSSSLQADLPDDDTDELPYESIIEGEDVEMLLKETEETKEILEDPPEQDEEEEVVEDVEDKPESSEKATNNESMAKVSCRYCQKELAKRYLTKHYRKMHSDQAVYICPKCDEPFKDWPDYKAHKTKHTKERNLVCSHCQVEYPSVSTYNRHLKQVKGQRDHVCEWCQKAFVEASSLKLHLRTHTKERQYKCEVEGCGKSFISKSSLTVHSRIHTGAKPYKCKFCDKCFSDSSTRNVHHRQHTGQNPFECPICGKTTKQKQNLKSHMKRMHKM